MSDEGAQMSKQEIYEKECFECGSHNTVRENRQLICLDCPERFVGR